MGTIVSPQTQNPNQQWDIIGQNNVELLAKTGFLLVLGIGLGHKLFLWYMTMYLHMTAYIHHPHIGIGSWLGSYVVFMVTAHVPSYESIHPSSILNHT